MLIIKGGGGLARGKGERSPQSPAPPGLAGPNNAAPLPHRRAGSESAAPGGGRRQEGRGRTTCRVLLRSQLRGGALLNPSLPSSFLPTPSPFWLFNFLQGAAVPAGRAGSGGSNRLPGL